MSWIRNKKSKYRFYIGIDPGVNTGLSLWDAEKQMFHSIQTLGILGAMEKIKQFHLNLVGTGEECMCIIENPNLRKYFGKTGRERLQGAGSIKRDYSIWMEFFKIHKFNFKPVAPRKALKIDANQFKILTGYAKRTSQHARDASMLIFNR